MFLLARILSIHAIRRSSRSREFFADLKKLYRSTTQLDLFMATNTTISKRTCFVFDKDESTKLLIQMIYDIPSTTIRRKFNLLRSTDEPVSQTIRRLTANIERAAKKENKSSKKRQQKQETAMAVEAEQINVRMLDRNDQPIEHDRSNKQAWLDCQKLFINDQIYHVEYNAPAIIKFRFPEIILSNTITIVLVDLDYGDWEHSIFDWYVTDEIDQPQETDDAEDIASSSTRWTHVHRGPMCTFADEHVNKFVRVACLPRNSSFREGMSAEYTSRTRIIPCPIDLPMNTRHALTADYFDLDSDQLRIVTYNILADCYAGSTGASEKMYAFCSTDYLAHAYRKPLLIRELLGYHADIISLQECDTKFFERELALIMHENGYEGRFKSKGDNVQEGEAIFYRTKRFTAIDTHNIVIEQYLREAKQTEYLRQRLPSLPDLHNDLLERNTVLQIVALERNENSSHVVLVCNTHLYFYPSADLLRMVQVMISFERINEIKQMYEKQNKRVSILYTGDFNANPKSLAFQLLFTSSLVADRTHHSYDQNYATFINNLTYKSPFQLSTYANYAYTNFMPGYNSVLDHIFFDEKNFQFQRCIPMPTHEEVTEFTGLPSCKIPSDHLAVIIELKMLT